ncbi:hypothetical protein [Methylobacterium planeticum]|uniref:Uncharacterized protein n=1 Tax=Methylobacterium planeticum TaxID=2615211 RepID=A0A6N6MJH2_9HYPH|nr:hypothetical protein [Methylobacterium planeticum]KAB1070140.1 hypothetical protein F6X51_23505 [Methylobacterium planeticum]
MQVLSHAARLSAAPVLALSALLVAEAGFLFGALSHLLTAPAALAGHAIVLVAFTAARRAFAEDLTLFVLALLLTACAGPLGTVGVLALYLMLSLTRVSPHELETWYRQISGVTEANPAVALYDRIVDGRARRSQAQSHFPSVLGGPLAPQQALLGLIGLAYHPDYRVLLRQALHSAEPSIRVHAAAVSVKLRTRARLDFQDLAGEENASGSPDDLHVRATRLVRLAEGGFLDEADTRTARETALDHCRRARALDPEHGPSLTLLCRLLSDLRRWDDVLSLRAAHGLNDRGAAATVAESLMKLRRARDLHDVAKRLALPAKTLSIGDVRHAPGA